MRKGDTMQVNLLGKCGFYCGCCPTYIKGGCKGCVDEHSEGNCATPATAFWSKTSPAVARVRNFRATRS